MPGPPPKPTAIKEAEGNRGKRRLNRAELAEHPEAPKCPAHLSSLAKREWRRLVPILLRRRILREEDLFNLANVCEAWSVLVSARKTMSSLPEDTRHLVKVGAGVMVNPLHYIIRDQIKIIQSIGAEFGFSPSARARLLVDDDLAAIAAGDHLESMLTGPAQHDASDPVVVH